MRLQSGGSSLRSDPNGSRGFPITGVLIVSFAVLVILAVAVLSIASYRVAFRNTVELVQDKAQLISSYMITRVQDYLDPVKSELEFIAVLIAQGKVDALERSDLGHTLLTSLSGVPQVSVIAFVHNDFLVDRVTRDGDAIAYGTTDWSDDPAVERTMQEQSLLSDASWGELFVAEESGNTFINIRKPVRHNGEFLGFLVAGVSVDQLSEFLLDFRQDYTYSPFILYDREYVLAHPLLQGGFPGLNDFYPLPHLTRFGDPVLSEIWSDARDEALEAMLAGQVEAHAVHYLGRTYVFLYQYLFDYGVQPWIVGTYLHLEDVAQPIGRLSLIPKLGIGILAIALVIAVLLGTGLSRSIRRLAHGARFIRHLDIDGAPSQRIGMFRELNEAALAFNAMLQALKSFETYVPRSLVLRLMKLGERASIESEERVVTILFTDIVGFTALSEQLPAREVADLLNEHFALIADCVEAEGGTVDKYIGDAVMAFWGAPELQPDHAERACNAANRIAERLAEYNLSRRRRGRAPVRVRMGVHSGLALVGNIGAPSRVNYTVIGDTVNTADRLEELCRKLAAPDLDSFTLLSEETAERLGPAFAVDLLGTHTLPGKEAVVTAYRLLADKHAGEGAARGGSLS